MPRKRNPERDRAIVAELRAGNSRSEVAARHRVTAAHTYRIEKYSAPTLVEQVSAPGLVGPGGDIFKQITTSGLRRYAGRVFDDYDKVFQTVNRRVQLYREMGDDPNVSAVLQAIKMLIRKVSWRVDTHGQSDADKAACAWMETVLDDMSLAWADVIDQALGMIQYGFYPAEIVYKKRAGLDPGKVAVVDSRGQESEEALPSSKYEDGKIGWRKWIFIAPESLAPGSEWEFDSQGGLRAIRQLPPPDYIPRYLPIEKAVLFRTTTEKNNPEGRSLLRGMYKAWWFATNLQEVEGIAAERMGAGLPVIYVGKNVGKNLSDPNSDAAKLQDIVRNIRVDEQMGVFVPYSKMGQGANPDEGVLIELLAPPSRGVVDFNQAITRWEQRMAMVGLSQFIHLGMNSVGARALGQTSQDFFSLAVGAWADSIAETVSRFAIDRLFKLNAFPDITAVPYLAHDEVGGVPLGEVADYVNKLAGAALITPSLELENHLREAANLPKRTATVSIGPPADGAETEVREGEAVAPDLEQPEGGKPSQNQKAQSASQGDEEMDKFMAMLLIQELKAATQALTAAGAPVGGPGGMVIHNATLTTPDKFSIEQPAPIINVHVPPQPAPNVTVNVPEQPAPVINLPAPVVNIAAPQMNMPAPIIHVTPDIKIEMPEMTEDSFIERDPGTGQIAHVTKRMRKTGG